VIIPGIAERSRTGLVEGPITVTGVAQRVGHQDIPAIWCSVDDGLEISDEETRPLTIFLTAADKDGRRYTAFIVSFLVIIDATIGFRRLANDRFGQGIRLRLIQQTPRSIPDALVIFFDFIRPTDVTRKWPTRFFTHFQNDRQK
jgi:hypothetical protein